MKTHHHNFIAESNHGACPLCELTMDVGEWLSKRVGGRVIHLGCTPKAACSSPEQFSLLSDNELESAIEEKSEAVESAKKTLGLSHLVFDGASALGIDLPRLAHQAEQVFTLMKDSQFRTLSEIASATGCLETSASARLRDFRKVRFGSHEVEYRQRSDKVNEYRLIVRERGNDEQRAA